MAPPAWAYQVDNFYPPPDEELICSICQNVFCDPVQSPCDHVFCRSCVSKWLENNRNCPICRKRTTRSTLKEVVPIVKNMILKLNLRCHNFERGCVETFTLEGCESHSKLCPYELIQCKNKPCKLMLMRKEIKHHETADCSHSYIRCDKCRMKVSSRNSEMHDCIMDMKKKLKEKSEKVKKLYQKIKKLREELKNLKESEDFSSDSTELQAADVFFDFVENSRSSSMDSQGSSPDGSEDEDFLWSQFRNPIVIAGTNMSLQEAINEASNLARTRENTSNFDSPQSSNSTSIEYPRASSPISFCDSSVQILDSTEPSVNIAENEEPQLIRRPTKRRLNTRVLSSSDDENQNEGVYHTYPSRKRTWQLSSQVDAGNSSTADAAGLNFLSSGAGSSASPNDSSSSDNRSNDASRPKAQSRSADQQQAITSAVASYDESMQQSVNPIFERTISLLRRYNIESDPEWFPPNPDRESLVEDSDNDPPYVLPGHITSSDESSISDLDNSESSYEDAPGDTFHRRKDDFLHSFYGSSDGSED